MEISSELPTDGVNRASWKYKNQTVADRVRRINHKFGNRLNFNNSTLSLTLTKLTLQDSGNFSFLSEQNSKQRETVIVTLQVYGKLFFFFLVLYEILSLCSFCSYCKVRMQYIFLHNINFSKPSKKETFQTKKIEPIFKN